MKALWLLLLAGCTLPTEPDSGCIQYASGRTFSGRPMYAYQCWGDAVPADSLDHPEWW